MISLVEVGGGGLVKGGVEEGYEVHRRRLATNFIYD